MGSVFYLANYTVRPGAYDPIDFGRFKKESKEVKFCYNKAARINFIDEIQKRETKMPSPLTYSPETKQKFGNIYNK